MAREHLELAPVGVDRARREAAPLHVAGVEVDRLAHMQAHSCTSSRARSATRTSAMSARTTFACSVSSDGLSRSRTTSDAVPPHSPRLPDRRCLRLHARARIAGSPAPAQSKRATDLSRRVASLERQMALQRKINLGQNRIDSLVTNQLASLATQSPPCRRACRLPSARPTPMAARRRPPSARADRRHWAEEGGSSARPTTPTTCSGRTPTSLTAPGPHPPPARLGADVRGLRGLRNGRLNRTAGATADLRDRPGKSVDRKCLWSARVFGSDP